MTTIEAISMKILRKLLLDFRSRGLTAGDLKSGYVGLSMENLRQALSQASASHTVDFDLALSDLELGGLIKMGPMESYANPPDAVIKVIGMFNKKEYLYLTEKGYKAVYDGKLSKKREPSPSQRVSISGGSFYHSPIGVGAEVNQTVTVNIENDVEVVEYLAKLLVSEKAGRVSQDDREEIKQLVTFTRGGDIASAKPLFQKLFGAVKEGAKAVAWGVISAIIAKQMGI